MRNITWNDNSGREGITCIHAKMTLADLDWLKSMHPRGYFVHTTFVTNMSLRQYATNVGVVPAYFYFPEDDKGIALLAALRLMGMGNRITMENI